MNINKYICFIYIIELIILNWMITLLIVASINKQSKYVQDGNKANML